MPLFIYIKSIVIITLFSGLFYLSGVKADTITVVTEQFEPYQFNNSDGQVTGYATDVIHALFELTGDKPNITILPWARAYSQALHNKNVMIYSMAHTQDRDQLFKWIAKLNEEKLYVWGLKSIFSEPVLEPQKFNSYIIALQKRSNPDQYFLKHKYKFKNVHYLSTLKQHLGMLYKGRVDLIVGAEQRIKERAVKLHYDFSKMIKVYEIDALNSELSVAFNLNTNADIVARFQRAAEKLEQTGVILSLKRKWGLIK